MKIENIDIQKIIFYDRNPRKNDHVIEQVKKAIKEFGFRVPITLKKDYTLIDGHLRVKAALKLGLQFVPGVFIDSLSEAQIRAFRISVNKLSELADWDPDLLQLEFDDLKLMDFDLNLTGFNLKEVKKLDFDLEERAEKKQETKEIDVSNFKLAHKCPDCGFEFNEK